MDSVGCVMSVLVRFEAAKKLHVNKHRSWGHEDAILTISKLEFISVTKSWDYKIDNSYDGPTVA